ncbi:MAG: YfhO family protein [Bacilli bacterium]|jgi:uncharacterized membrane protein YfhO|nr:YfhO family protein [Bacilli bacterium]
MIENQGKNGAVEVSKKSHPFAARVMSFNEAEEKHENKKAFFISREVILPILSFVLPFLLCVILFAVNGFYPFALKGHTILMIDAQSQYIAYYRYFKGILERNESLVYTMSKLYGGNFLSIYTYYLASPLNFLIVFCPYDAIPAFMLWTSIIKISLTGLTMYALLRLDNGKARFSYLAFGVAYALCSYSFVYLSNLMWLDDVMILPLVVLGINDIFRKKRYYIYPLALAFSLMTSWYIGAMICIFSVFYFIYKCLAYYGLWRKENVRKKFPLWNLFWPFALFSIIGGSLAGSWWFAAFYHLAGTKASAFSYLFGGPNMTFASLLQGFMENNYYSSELIRKYEGYVTMFVATTTLPFFMLFLFNKNYSRWERFSALGLFLFYMLCMYSFALNILMHGGKSPTWFPTRYSFVACFMLTYFGAKQVEKTGKNPLWSYAVPPLIMLAAVLIAAFSKDLLENTFKDNISFVGVALFLIVDLLLFFDEFMEKKNPKFSKLLAILTSLVIVPLSCYSAYRGAEAVVVTNIDDNQYQAMTTFNKDTIYQDDFNALYKYDSSGNYRMENTFIRPGAYNLIDNDAMFYGFKGLSHYSSSEDKAVEEYTRKLGFQYNGFFEGYDGGSTLAANCYLGLKYIFDDTSLERQNNHPLFIYNDALGAVDKLTEITPKVKTVSVYRNNWALPLGMAVTSDNSFVTEGESVTTASGKIIKWYEDFEYQNAIYKALTDQVYEIDSEGKKVQKDIFKKIPMDSYDTFSGAELVAIDPNFSYRYYNAPVNSSIEMKFTVPEEAYKNNYNLYFYFKKDDESYSGSAYFNEYFNTILDESSYEMGSYWHMGIRGFKDNSTHTHTLEARFKKLVVGYKLQEEVYYEDLSVLKEYIEAIKKQAASSLKPLRSFNRAGFEGTFNLTSASSTFLFTLPNEKGISIYVDGTKKDVKTGFNIFSTVDIKGLELGEHKISIQYSDKGFTLGFIMSLLGLMGLGGFYIVTFLKNKKKKEGQEKDA